MPQGSTISTTVRIDAQRQLQATIHEGALHMRLLEWVPNPMTQSVNKRILKTVEGSYSIVELDNKEALSAYLETQQLSDFTDDVIGRLLARVDKERTRGFRLKES